MNNWLSNIRYRLRSAMQGRYGYDELSRFLNISGLVLLLLSLVPYLRILYYAAFAVILWSWFRSLSKNIYKRQNERQKFLAIRNRVIKTIAFYRDAWRYRKTHKYYKCPHCKATVRIRKPEKGKKINIRCPKCNQAFVKRT